MGKHMASEALESSFELRCKSLSVAFRQTAGGRSVWFIDALPQSEATARWKSPRIGVKSKGRSLLIDPAEVLAVQSDGNYVLLQKNTGAYLLREQIFHTCSTSWSLTDSFAFIVPSS